MFEPCELVIHVAMWISLTYILVVFASIICFLMFFQIFGKISNLILGETS